MTHRVNCSLTNAAIQKLDILGAIHRARLPYTIIDVGCWFQVFVPKIPSGRSDHAHYIYIDHRIVEDGSRGFALTDMVDIGNYVAKIVSDSRTLNKHVFAVTEVLSMNEIWDTMAAVSGETPPKAFVGRLCHFNWAQHPNYKFLQVTEAEIKEIIRTCGKKLQASSESPHHPNYIMSTANFNM
jgi:hypothetical protein